MYASKRSIKKANGSEMSKTVINKLRHKGMQKDHIQVTPDGKMIQHYKMDSRSAAVMKAFKKAQKEEVTEESPEKEATK